ncbi:MAG: hypothetical protein JNM68_16750, partial [Dinghuibacter sp.]|nr:hypothetical protein [Dinghuibacter sp.]
MKPILSLAAMLFFIMGVTQAQEKITADLEYDFKTGHLFLINTNPVGMKKKSGNKHAKRLYTLKEGQGISVNVKNLNPLKYYTELNGNYQSLNTPIPAITAIGVDDYFKL